MIRFKRRYRVRIENEDRPGWALYINCIARGYASAYYHSAKWVERKCKVSSQNPTIYITNIKATTWWRPFATIGVEE